MSDARRVRIVASLSAVVLLLGVAFFWIRHQAPIDVRHMVSVTERAAFTEAYVTRSEPLIVEVPESYEALQVALVLSEGGASNMVQQTGYHQAVQSWFAAHTDHEAIERVAACERDRGYPFVRRLSDFALDDAECVPAERFREYRDDEMLATLGASLAGFCSESGFPAFYRTHKVLYRQVVEDVHATMDIGRMRTWLDTRFGRSFDVWRIVLSPLSAGSHNTRHLVDAKTGHEEIVMYLSPVSLVMKTEADDEDRLMAERMLFTEAVHNYVNPLTNQPENLAPVIRIFGDLSFWKTKAGYELPALCFNEYMTWGAFLLYVQDVEPDRLEAVRAQTVDLMHQRGFIRFSAFADGLLSLAGPDTDLPSLYAPMLDWCEAYRHQML